MADPDYSSMTDEELLQAAHAAGVGATPHAPANAKVTQGAPEGLSTLEKVGLGVAGGAGAALAIKFPELRESIANLASKAGTEAPLWAKAGLRTAEDSPIARNLAGPSGAEALRLHTRDVSRVIAANEAGIPAAQVPILSPDIVTDARRGPNSVYDRVEKALLPGGLDPQAQTEIAHAGLPTEGRMSAGSPQAQKQIEDLRQQLLDPQRKFSGTQIINEMRGLRQEGYTNIASDDVSNQQLGRAQLDMARAIEGHVGRNIPPGSDVSLDQFVAARKTLAKNFTVQSALRGGDVDLKALARIQRADPGMLDGGTKMLADFADTHPEVAGLPTEASRYNPPGITRDVADISLKNPASWMRPLVGEAARRYLVGDTEEAIAQANQAFPAKAPGAFSPLPIPPTPQPKFGGYLPSPVMVNAGGGASTANTLESLGLTPDVQAAGAQHPAAARLQALREYLSRPPMEQVEFQGPQKWGDFSLEGNPPTQAPQDGIPFENVLEQGGNLRKPVAGIDTRVRQAPQSPKGPNMRTPPGAPELTEYTPYTPSAAQLAFRNKLAADRLRKVAGDLSVEGPGGATGDPIERLRAALERRERGYAEGGAVIDFAKRGAETLMQRIEDAFHNPYTADWNQLRQDISKYWTTTAPTATKTAEIAPPEALAAPKEPSLDEITQSLHDLLASQPPETLAEGGPVDDDSQSSVRTVANVARNLNPYSTAQSAEDRARIATNLASLAYGLDAQGRPAFGGRAWTQSQGGTPAGILDALTATPHNLIQMAATLDHYLPGQSNPKFWASIDPQWSQAAAQRLAQLRQRMQQAAGVPPAKTLEETGLDIVTDPATVAPVGTAKALEKGSAIRKALMWGAGGTEDPAKPAQGFAKGGSVKRVRPIQEFPRDERGLFIEPDVLTKEVIVQIEHNRQRAANKAYYSDTHCGNTKTLDPKRKYNCGACNQADGEHCLFVEDDLLPKLKNGRFPPLVIDHAKGSCGPWEIIDPNDPEQRGNRMPASIAGYAVRKGGGPEEVFGCWQCWKQKKSKHPALLGRTDWCGEWGTTVEPGACCVVNGAPEEKRN